MQTKTTTTRQQPRITVNGEWNDELIVAALVKVVVKKVRETERQDAKQPENTASQDGIERNMPELQQAR